MTAAIHTPTRLTPASPRWPPRSTAAAHLCRRIPNATKLVPKVRGSQVGRLVKPAETNVNRARRTTRCLESPCPRPPEIGRTCSLRVRCSLLRLAATRLAVTRMAGKALVVWNRVRRCHVAPRGRPSGSRANPAQATSARSDFERAMNRSTRQGPGGSPNLHRRNFTRVVQHSLDRPQKCPIRKIFCGHVVIRGRPTEVVSVPKITPPSPPVGRNSPGERVATGCKLVASWAKLVHREGGHR